MARKCNHLYRDQQLVFADESQKIWFIGDSKYYSDKNDIVGESVYKQFTYARNIIQYNISDLLNYKGDGKDYQGLRYRDSLTEGYSVTPNFFIRGEVPADKIFEMPAAAGAIRKDDVDLWNERNRHFENRLFDRDTLLLQVYNVNFLYVLKAFTAKNSSLRTEFKRTAREKFRRNFLTLLDEKYVFWAVWPKTEWKDGDKVFEDIARVWLPEDEKLLPIKSFVSKYGRILAGKMFRPSEDFVCLIIALESSVARDESSRRMWRQIEPDCKHICRVTPQEIYDEKETVARWAHLNSSYSAFELPECYRGDYFSKLPLDEDSIPVR